MAWAFLPKQLMGQRREASPWMGLKHGFPAPRGEVLALEALPVSSPLHQVSDSAAFSLLSKKAWSLCSIWGQVSCAVQERGTLTWEKFSSSISSW